MTRLGGAGAERGRRLGLGLFAYFIVVIHQVLFVTLILAARSAPSGHGALGAVLAVGFFGSWFALVAAAAWLAPVVVGGIAASSLSTPQASGGRFVVLVAICLGLGALAAGLTPAGYALVYDTGVSPEIMTEQASLRWFLGLEGGAVIALIYKPLLTQRPP